MSGDESVFRPPPSPPPAHTSLSLHSSPFLPPFLPSFSLISVTASYPSLSFLPHSCPSSVVLVSYPSCISGFPILCPLPSPYPHALFSFLCPIFSCRHILPICLPFPYFSPVLHRFASFTVSCPSFLSLSPPVPPSLPPTPLETDGRSGGRSVSGWAGRVHAWATLGWYRCYLVPRSRQSPEGIEWASLCTVIWVRSLVVVVAGVVGRPPPLPLILVFVSSLSYRSFLYFVPFVMFF